MVSLKNHSCILNMFFPPPKIPSVILNLAETSGKTPLAPEKISSHPSDFSLCSLTHDSSVIYPRERSTAALNQPFVSLDTPFIIFPGRADSEQRFKASSRLAHASAVALGNRPLSPRPLQRKGWGELISSTPLSTKVKETSGSTKRCSGHDLYPLRNTQTKLKLRSHTHTHTHAFIFCMDKYTSWAWRCLGFLFLFPLTLLILTRLFSYDIL